MAEVANAAEAAAWLDGGGTSVQYINKGIGKQAVYAQIDLGPAEGEP
jgi:hypothetical protein